MTPMTPSTGLASPARPATRHSSSASTLFAAVAIMMTGVAVLGLLAGSLASFFRLDQGEPAAGPPGGEPARPASTSNDVALATLTAEVAALRRQVAALTERLTAGRPDLVAEERLSGEDAGDRLT